MTVGKYYYSPKVLYLLEIKRYKYNTDFIDIFADEQKRKLLFYEDSGKRILFEGHDRKINDPWNHDGYDSFLKEAVMLVQEEMEL